MCAADHEDAPFSLTQEQRELARLRVFDGDALEAFVRRHSPDARAELLRSLLGAPPSSSPAAVSNDARLPDAAVLIAVSDPELHELLERMWAPRWRGMSLAALERRPPDLPGIQRAIRDAREASRPE